ncbi:hypothetical protein Bhyg_05813 [Pseudolycoriella hygida]|uniref:Uncharacterized protein n=1 Tax=Pseudolycoriella hygida TaxID=35572 RepID=A0A9Q0MZL5_9DIPT|nr:hypothetical protein Bhyg_05813 [Pseudolycoriella hygida]
MSLHIKASQSMSVNQNKSNV